MLLHKGIPQVEHWIHSVLLHQEYPASIYSFVFPVSWKSPSLMDCSQWHKMCLNISILKTQKPALTYLPPQLPSHLCSHVSPQFCGHIYIQFLYFLTSPLQVSTLTAPPKQLHPRQLPVARSSHHPRSSFHLIRLNNFTELVTLGF